MDFVAGGCGCVAGFTVVSVADASSVTWVVGRSGIFAGLGVVVCACVDGLVADVISAVEALPSADGSTVAFDAAVCGCVDGFTVV